MENIFGKVALYLLCLLAILMIIFMLAPAWFIDYESIKLIVRITDCYYVAKDNSSPKNDYLIVYHSESRDESQSIRPIADLCQDIYFNADTIMYSNIAFTGSKVINYFVIPIHTKRADRLINDPIQIEANEFKKNNVRFSRVKLR